MRGTFFDRFWEKVREDPVTGCWVWRGCRGDGYGFIYVGNWCRHARTVHRLSYREWVGPIPTWLQVDHLCRNRACVNPQHLELVTQQENMRRGEGGTIWRLKRCCSKGHPFDEANTYHYRGHRQCRLCNMLSARRRRARSRVLATAA